MTETTPIKAECCTPEPAGTAPELKTFLPRADILESKDAFIVVADMPGVDENSLDITLEKDLLTLRGKVAPPSLDGYEYGYVEYEEGHYERAFTLGDTVDRDAIQATVKNGLVRITLPKAGPSKAQKIAVKVS